MITSSRVAAGSSAGQIVTDIMVLVYSLQVGAGASSRPASVHDAGVGEPGGGGALHPGRPLLVQV